MEMVNHLMDAPCTNDGEASTPAGKIPTEWFSPVSDLSNPVARRPREVSRPVPGEPGEVLVEDSTEYSEVWEILYKILDNPCEQQVAY
jgi:hypothetical protein